MPKPIRNSAVSSFPPGRFLLVGGRVAVDFANTVHSVHGPPGALADWPGLIAFLEQVGTISPHRTAELLHMELADPQAVDALLYKALALRSSLRQGFQALERGQRLERAVIEPLNELLRVTEGHDELVSEHHEWRLRFIAREERPEWLLAAIARSAAEILAEGPAAPLRKCASAECVLFFYDTSRTGRRRWCSMTACGNRSKVAAFARRHASRRGA
jgi:predicted RNA-binding Zn ribbon-like protein